MNFIIAVVNESYANCMAKLIATSYQTKVEMIVERESIMSDTERLRNDWFPRFIILRKEVDKKTEDEWKGFVKELQVHNERQTSKIQAQLIKTHDEQEIRASEFKKQIRSIKNESTRDVHRIQEEVYGIKEDC